MKKGFTLIELLVVVLIIGILSAIALPQYTKAVEKARATEAVQNISALQKAIDVYVLENGYPSSGITRFLGNNATGVLDIDITAGMNCSVRGGDECSNKHFAYYALCTATYCQVSACRLANGNNACLDSDYELELIKNKSTDVWNKTCYYWDDRDTEFICKGLEPLGFTRGSCC